MDSPECLLCNQRPREPLDVLCLRCRVMWRLAIDDLIKELTDE